MSLCDLIHVFELDSFKTIKTKMFSTYKQAIFTKDSGDHRTLALQLRHFFLGPYKLYVGNFF